MAFVDHSSQPTRMAAVGFVELNRHYNLCMWGVEADNRPLGCERMSQPYGNWPALKANPRHARRSLAYQAEHKCRLRRHLSLENSRPVLVEDANGGFPERHL
jgi:hypothetical protein